MGIDINNYESEMTRRVLAEALYSGEMRLYHDKTISMLDRLCASARDDYGVLADVEEAKKAMLEKKAFERYVAEKGLAGSEDAIRMMKEIDLAVDSLAQEQADNICRALYSGRMQDIGDAVKDAEKDLKIKIEKKEITHSQLSEMKKRYYAIAEILDI
ncbi:hypothetical protein COV19_06170 [Candidatus Woesearchaeota archaeon CG10_big_fil_rev_8_21_14_0_10_44_13]|nr:MAG: hypothetical protein COV19_06170 [Candidatus Woesearchaeota archaeon CG10_big_fil_rev_8_21_14_0_10_44_13]